MKRLTQIKPCGRVLVLAPTAKDSALAVKLLKDSGIDAVPCQTLDCVMDEMGRSDAAIVTAEAVLADRSDRLVRFLREQPAWSDFPLILLTPAGREQPGAIQALEAIGNMSFIPRPLQVSTLLSAVKSALRYRQRQYVTRDYLAELEEARKKAEAASIAKSDFLANMSHEIRTPMQAMLGVAELLAMNDTIKKHEGKLLSILKNSADTLLMLINDMLDMAKIEANKIKLECAPFEPALLIEQCVSVIAAEAQRKGLDLRFSVEDIAGVRVRGDQLRVRQILVNLLSNAVKFTNEGQITVESAYVTDDAGGGRLAIIVRDTGIGIKPEAQAKIFGKFNQADASTTRRYGGTGLGLSIAGALVDLMGGTIGLNSEAGKGSAFTVMLPLPLDTAEEAARPPVESGAVQPGIFAGERGGKILLVDDYEPNLLIAKTMLKKFGYEFDTAMSGREALTKLETGDFSLLLLDVQMPDLDGYETTRFIREKEAERKKAPLPIIAVTAHALAGNRERCLEAGMNDFLPKPFSSTQLHEKIENFMAEELKVFNYG